MSNKTTKGRSKPRKNQTQNISEKEKAISAPRPPSMVLGDSLEYRVTRLNIFMGYFVRRGCPIYTIAALDRATDLDVLAIRFTEPFRCETTVTECKSGDTAPLDRIFWLAGVKSYMGASQAFLARKGTKWNIKDFAKECGVQIIDLQRLSEIEKAYNINEDDWPGISERSFFEAELAKWNEILMQDKRFWELYITLTSEIKYDDIFVGINYILPQLRHLTKTFTSFPNNSYYRFLISECISQLSMFITRVVEKCFDLDEKDREGFITKGLKYGNIEPHYAERVMNSAYNLAQQAILHYASKDIRIEKSLFSIPTPPGGNELISFINKLILSYPRSITFPQMCDLILFERFTKNRDAKGWLKRIFPHSDLSARFELVREYLKFLIDIGACPKYVFECVEQPITGKSGNSPDGLKMKHDESNKSELDTKNQVLLNLNE